jgi:hypothetical protein
MSLLDHPEAPMRAVQTLDFLMKQLPELSPPFQAIAADALLKAADPCSPDDMPPEFRERLDSLAENLGLGPVELNIVEVLLLNAAIDGMRLNSRIGSFIDLMSMRGFSGRGWLAVALGCPERELMASLDSLERLGIIDMSSDLFGLHLVDKSAFTYFPGGTSGEALPGGTGRVGDSLPTDRSGVGGEEARYALRLLGAPGDRPCHVLLYGPPGSGKAAFARGLVRRLGAPSWAVAPAIPREEGVSGMALLEAASERASLSRGSVVIVEGAENAILDISPPVGPGDEELGNDWLNMFMERPGNRFIWIAEDPGMIGPTVRRRFGFSIRFPTPVGAGQAP